MEYKMKKRVYNGRNEVVIDTTRRVGIIATARQRDDGKWEVIGMLCQAFDSAEELAEYLAENY